MHSVHATIQKDQTATLCRFEKRGEWGENKRARLKLFQVVSWYSMDDGVGKTVGVELTADLNKKIEFPIKNALKSLTAVGVMSLLAEKNGLLKEQFSHRTIPPSFHLNEAGAEVKLPPNTAVTCADPYFMESFKVQRVLQDDSLEEGNPVIDYGTGLALVNDHDSPQTYRMVLPDKQIMFLGLHDEVADGLFSLTMKSEHQVVVLELGEKTAAGTAVVEMGLGPVDAKLRLIKALRSASEMAMRKLGLKEALKIDFSAKGSRINITNNYPFQIDFKPRDPATLGFFETAAYHVGGNGGVISAEAKPTLFHRLEDPIRQKADLTVAIDADKAENASFDDDIGHFCAAGYINSQGIVLPLSRLHCALPNDAFSVRFFDARKKYVSFTENVELLLLFNYELCDRYAAPVTG